ncbi:MAG: hypothetical protein ACPGUV_11510 [Polyangiales bacterium]
MQRKAWQWALFAGVVAACGGGSAPPPATPPPAVPSEPRLVVEFEALGEDAEAQGERRLADDEQRLLADDIALRSASKHGQLPPMQRSAEGQPDAWPRVTIENATPHRLVVFFAGPCPRSIALLPKGIHAVEFCEGKYDVAAELSAPNFLPFVGEDEQLESGYAYSVKFYVMPGRR